MTQAVVSLKSRPDGCSLDVRGLVVVLRFAAGYFSGLMPVSAASQR